MELKAEQVIKDCEFALCKHNSTLQGAEFRLSWWTIISLLRAIGHVLKNVDKKISTNHARIIDNEYKKLSQSKPKPEIYWCFIQTERNNFLKEYNYGVRRQLTNSWQTDDGKTASLSVLLDDQSGGRITPLLPSMYQESFIKEGYYKGQDEHKIAEEALSWWKEYIENIKREFLKVNYG